MACFKNKENGYTECVSNLSFLWCFLFGIIYLAIKGLWTHVVAISIFGIITGGVGFLVAWLIYPFFINQIINKKYLRDGWVLI